MDKNSLLKEYFKEQQIQILLADDESDLREVLKDTLNDKIDVKFIIDEATDGETALNLIQKKKYDLCILDLNMPKKSGFDVLKYVRGKEDKEHTPNTQKSKILILSGYIDKLEANSERKELLMLEKHLLSKPFKMVEFLEQTQNILLSIKK
ncbi:MAG: response regulator [Oligoflexia bacterium]|nr:response regulator [Oligoflexia bacterium]